MDEWFIICVIRSIGIKILDLYLTIYCNSSACITFFLIIKCIYHSNGYRSQKHKTLAEKSYSITKFHSLSSTSISYYFYFFCLPPYTSVINFLLLNVTQPLLCYNRARPKNRFVSNRDDQGQLMKKSHGGVHLVTCRSVYGEIRLVNGLQLALALTNHKCQPVLTSSTFETLLSVIFPLFFFFFVPIILQNFVFSNFSVKFFVTEDSRRKFQLLSKDCGSTYDQLVKDLKYFYIRFRIQIPNNIIYCRLKDIKFFKSSKVL